MRSIVGKLVVAFMAFSAAGAASAADRWRIGDFGGATPDQLVEYSFNSPSIGIKERVRSYLAEKYPDTPAGLLARAWLSGRKARPDEAESVALLEQCVRIKPDHVPCLYNLAASYSTGKQIEKALAVRRKVLALDARYADRNVLLHAYENLGNDLGRPADAEALLAQYRGAVGDSYIWDYIAATNAVRAKNFPQALARLEAARGKADAPFEVWRYIAQLSTGELFDSRRGKQPVEIALAVVIDYLQSAAASEAGKREALAWMRENYGGALGGSAAGARLREMELGLNRSAITPELLAAQQDMRDYRAAANAIKAFVPDPAQTEVPYELDEWSLANLRTGGASAAVQNAWERAILNAYSEQQRNQIYARAINETVLYGYCDAAAQLARNVRARLPAYRHATYEIEAALCGPDTAAARQALGAYETDTPVYRSDLERTAQLEGAARQRQQYAQTHAFLDRWYQRFGDQLEIKIEFATGAARLPAGGEAELKKVAALLKESDANGYVFEISGHTDSKGNLAANTALSEQRARAVSAGLAAAGVPAERLRSSGYGPASPRASNSTEAGRQRNRRVEVRPVGNVGEPRLASREGLPWYGALRPMAGGRFGVMQDVTAGAWMVDLVKGIRLQRYAEGVPQMLVRNDRYLLSAYRQSNAIGGNEEGLIVYDVKTGEAIARRAILNAGLAAALNPAQDELAVPVDGGVVVYDLPSLKTKRVARVFNKTCASQGIAWLDNGQIAVACSNHDRIQVLNAASLKPERELTGVRWVHGMAQSGDGKYLVVGDDGGMLRVWEIAGWRKHGELKVPSGVPNKLEVRPDSSEVALGGNGKETQRIDVAALRVLDQWSTDYGFAATYSRDGRLLYQSYTDHWRARDLESNNVTRLASGGSGDGARQVIAFPDSNRLLIKSAAGSEIFDAATFTRAYDLAPFGSSFDQVDKNLLLLFDRETMRWRQFDVSGLTFAAEGEIAAAQRDALRDNDTERIWGRNVLVTLRHANKKGSPELRTRVAIRDMQGNVRQQLELELVTEQLSIGAYETGHRSILSPSGRWLAVWPNWRDGYGTSIVNAKRVYVVDTQSGKLANTYTYANAPLGIEFTGGDQLAVKFGGSWTTYALPAENGTVARYGNESRLALDGGREVVYRDRGNMHLAMNGKAQQFIDMHGTLEGVAWLPQAGLLVDIADGIVEVRNARDLSLKFNLRMRGEGGWIAYTPDGYFAASPKGADNLFWNVGEDYLPFDALRQRFERPQLIRQALADTVVAGAAAPAITAPVQVRQEPVAAPAAQPAIAPGVKLEADLFAPPYTLKVAGDATRQTSADNETLTIAVQRTRAGAEPYQLEFSLNGRVLSQTLGARGLSRVSSCGEGGACEEKHQFKADLEPGLNVVTVSLVYRNVRLDPQTVAVTRKVAGDAAGASAPATAAAAGVLPRLWFFGVGVSQYADKSMNLEYAHADALALAEMFKRQQGKLYGEVNTKVLTNAQATTEGVRVEMNRFLRGATQQDVVVVFLAGHGMLDTSQTLYFMTHDSRGDEPFTGMDVGVVHDLLGKRPPAQKAVVMLDICHSGATGSSRSRGGASSSDEAIKLLSQGSGVKVMTASTARELSVENASFGGGHGAFTAALLEGLGGAAAQGGTVTVQGLETFVARRVQEMTSNRQHPTSSSDKFQDYPLARR